MFIQLDAGNPFGKPMEIWEIWSLFHLNFLLDNNLWMQSRGLGSRPVYSVSWGAFFPFRFPMWTVRRSDWAGSKSFQLCKYDVGLLPSFCPEYPDWTQEDGEGKTGDGKVAAVVHGMNFFPVKSQLPTWGKPVLPLSTLPYDIYSLHPTQASNCKNTQKELLQSQIGPY